MIKVIDDFLPPAYFNSISENIFVNFPWYYKNDITFPREQTLQHDGLGGFGFEHLIVDNNTITSLNMYNVLLGFFGILRTHTNSAQIIKCRVDMTVCTRPKFKHVPHVDLFSDHFASVFYLNDSDGETVIYEEKCFSMQKMRTVDFESLTIKQIVKPKANRVLIFDGRYLHTGHSPSENKNRVIINTDLI